jgi:hypothetical protein
MFGVNTEAIRRSIMPVATEIIVRHYDRTTTEYDSDTQTPTTDFEDTTIYADVQNVTQRQILNSGGKIMPETKQIIVPTDVCVSELDDIFVDNTTLQAIEVKLLTNRRIILANKKLE